VIGIPQPGKLSRLAFALIWLLAVPLAAVQWYIAYEKGLGFLLGCLRRHTSVQDHLGTSELA
jgi:hypothetical protein